VQAVATRPIATRADAEKAVRRGARVAAMRAGAEAARDIAVVRAGATNKDRIDELTAEENGIRAAVAEWAKENREEFAGKQELALDAGVLAFRVGNRRVEILEGWTIQTVIACMIRAGRVLAGWRSWVKISFDLDKRKILSDSAGENPKLTAKLLESAGLKITQDETFDLEFLVEAKP
jgi:hypothetical protein